MQAKDFSSSLTHELRGFGRFAEFINLTGVCIPRPLGQQKAERLSQKLTLRIR
jgi:hypothetical protein